MDKSNQGFGKIAIRTDNQGFKAKDKKSRLLEITALRIKINMPNITKSSTAEYFAKNLQQVGFSSPTKAVLTTLKEAVDNSLDACEDAGIAPFIKIQIKKEGLGSSRNTDLISVTVEDNGPGLEEKNIKRVFGEYLASSKFGRRRCSRGQQGIGISAATTWAQLTNAKGAHVVSKTKNSAKAISVVVDMDIKNNKGILKNKQTVFVDKKQGLKVQFFIDGRVQLKGDGGLITYLEGTALVNPHLEMEYQLLDQELKKIARASSHVPKIPPAALPHPHTMKLGEFLQHAGLYGRITLKKFLKNAFSRISDKVLKEMRAKGLSEALLNKALTSINEREYKNIFSILHKIPLANPSTQSVLAVGEEGLAESIHRLGDIDFFSLITRKPKICDYKSVVAEVAIARLKDKDKEEDTIQLLRFANRVPLQFDKASCAITKAVESVNWRAYGLSQSKKSLPTGPYVFAISVTSPFIKFKNASKETIDASEELVEEIRLALMQTGQKLKKHIRKEKNTKDLLRKKEYIEKFAPILIRKIKDISGASLKEMEKGEKGLYAILSRDADKAEKALGEAQIQLEEMKAKRRQRLKEEEPQALKSAKKSQEAKKFQEAKKSQEAKKFQEAKKSQEAKKFQTLKAAGKTQEAKKIQGLKAKGEKFQTLKEAKKIQGLKAKGEKFQTLKKTPKQNSQKTLSLFDKDLTSKKSKQIKF